MQAGEESVRATIKECLINESVPPELSQILFDHMKDVFGHMIPEIDIHTVGRTMLALGCYWMNNPYVDLPVTLRDISVSMLYIGDRLMTETELEQQYRQ